MLGKRHLVEPFVNAFVAQSANPNARAQRALIHMFAKIRATMNFARDQMMEGQTDRPVA